LCSFCGKSHAEVKKLIAGPGVYICEQLRHPVQERLDKELAAQAKKPRAKFNIPSPQTSSRQLDRHCIGQEHAKKTLAVAVHNHYKRILQEAAECERGRGGGKRRAAGDGPARGGGY